MLTIIKMIYTCVRIYLPGAWYTFFSTIVSFAILLTRSYWNSPAPPVLMYVQLINVLTIRAFVHMIPSCFLIFLIWYPADDIYHIARLPNKLTIIGQPLLVLCWCSLVTINTACCTFVHGPSDINSTMVFRRICKLPAFLRCPACHICWCVCDRLPALLFCFFSSASIPHNKDISYGKCLKKNGNQSYRRASTECENDEMYSALLHWWYRRRSEVRSNPTVNTWTKYLQNTVVRCTWYFLYICTYVISHFEWTLNENLLLPPRITAVQGANLGSALWYNKEVPPRFPGCD